jgi:hypothetical protein
MAVSALVTNVTERYILRLAQNKWREYVILALSRDKVGNSSGSGTNRSISSTIVNQEFIP